MTSIAAAPIPRTHRDLFDRPVVAVFTTLLPSGQPHSSLVWIELGEEGPEVNTTLERQHGRDLVRNAKASVLVVDPDDTSRFVQIRGDVELDTHAAEAHLDGLTRKYTPHPSFYGYVYPVEQRARETRVVCRLHARRVQCDAIHH